MKHLLIAVFCLSIFSCAIATQEKDAKTWQYYYDLGMSSLVAKNYSEAIANFFLASHTAPNEPKIWNSLGLAYMEVSEYEKAEGAFKKALEVDRRFTEAKLNLGILHFRKKDYERSMKELREALSDEAFPHKHIAFYYLAKMYKVLDNQSLYLENLKRATLYNPMFLDAQLELASAYEEIGDYRQALDVYKNLIGNGINNPQIELNMARLMLYLEDYERAKIIIKGIVESRQTEINLKSQAYDLLSQILIKEQEKLIVKREPITERVGNEPKTVQSPAEREQKEQTTAKEPPPTDELQGKSKNVIKIQLGAFSSEGRAKAWKEKLEKEIGIKDLTIVEQFGIYRVLYGNFKSRAEAESQLEKLKAYNLYGFIVQE